MSPRRDAWARSHRAPDLEKLILFIYFSYFFFFLNPGGVSPWQRVSGGQETLLRPSAGALGGLEPLRGRRQVGRRNMK